jgi:hypothetical protein
MPKGQFTSPFRRGRRQPIEDRFWEKVDQSAGPDACWPWIGALFRSTKAREFWYGQFQLDGSPRLAHRVAWLLVNGEIPDGIKVLHTCDNPPCCNPTHLFLGTTLDNNRDMMAKGRGRFPGPRVPAAGNKNGSRTKPESRPRGESHPKTNLTNDQVVEMRRLHHEGVKQVRLAERYGIDKTVVSKIITRRTWTHLP